MKADADGFHFVIAPVGSLGDFLPALGIARELQSLGHRVDLVATEFFRPQVQETTLSFIGYGSATQFKRDLADPRTLDPAQPYLPEMLVAPSILPQYQAVERAVVQSGSRVVVLTTGSGVGALWAAKCFGLCSIGLMSSPPILGIFRSHRPAVEGVYRAAFRASGIHSLPPAVYDPQHCFTGEFTVAFDFLLEMFPRWFEHQGIERAANAIAGTFPLASTAEVEPALRDFLDSGDAPWVFFPGSGGALLKQRPDLKELMVQFAERAQRRVVMVDNAQQTRMEYLSERAVTLRSTSMSDLLPHACGLLHHGGVGGTSHALAQGLPQIIVPVSFDQPGNAAWLEAAGVGITCRPAELSVDRLCDMVATAEAQPRTAHELYAQRLYAEGGARGLAERLLTHLHEVSTSVVEAAT